MEANGGAELEHKSTEADRVTASMSTAENPCLDSSPASPPIKKPRWSAAGGTTTGVSDKPSVETVTSENNCNSANDNQGNGFPQPTDQQNGAAVPEIDESLYSRQIYVLGKEAMTRMLGSNVLISGLGGLGVEIAKNVCLAGVRSVTLHDTLSATFNDLSSQFYLKESDIGKNRAEVSLSQLTELNSNVKVNKHTEALTEAFLKNQFEVVVISDSLSVSSMLGVQEIATFCHENNTCFILAETRGVFSRLFTDFGESFLVTDVNGEAVKSAMIAGITAEEVGVVTCLDETRHGLENGDFVTFQEVDGMLSLNGCQPIEIKVTGPYTFTIGDTRGFGEYANGGVVTQVKMPVTLSFKPFTEALKNPEILKTDPARESYPIQLHLGFRALDIFIERQQRLPRPWSAEDSTTLVEIANEINASDTEKSKVETIDEKLLRIFASVSSGNLCPMNAFLGGVAAQEVMKACSGKFTPIKQWLYFDAIECLPQYNTEYTINEADYAPTSSRYDGTIAIFGKKYQKKLENLKYFLVGSGAIGCELLKSFAMLGIGTGVNGQVIVTDMDLIERSNLNRQFLFRTWDVGNSKSVTAAKAVKEMNPGINIVHQENRVGPETESFYNDAFFERLDGVANALDNVEARLYMDRRCVYYRKPLLESGTLGTQGSTQVVLPYLTESYGSSQDPPEKAIPICTLKNFPHAIEHTLQWARDLFEGLFSQSAVNASQYLSDPDGFVARTLRLPVSDPKETLESIKKFLIDERPTNFEDCVKWARLVWEENFNNQIQQLLFNFPADQTTSTGQLFWSGPKRCPKALNYTVANDLALANDFIYAGANLRAEMYGIPQLREPSKVAELAAAIEVPQFIPKSGVRISITDAEAQNHGMSGSLDSDRLENLQISLRNAAPSFAGLKITALEFEKDDDTNLHIDFIVAASNSRATNYAIAPADRLKSKLIAGKIIPAIATTTSVVAGLISLELLKVTAGFNTLDRYKNGYVNLALPSFTSSEPIQAPRQTYMANDQEQEWTLWDRIEVSGEMTLGKFMEYFKTTYDLEITMLSHGVCNLYTSFMDEAKKNKRMGLPLCELVCQVSGRKLESHIRALVFHMCCSYKDKDGKEADVPYVRYLIPDSELNKRSSDC